MTNEGDAFDVQTFTPYSQGHKALSWWAMTVLAAVPLLSFLAGQRTAALITVGLFVGFILIDPVARKLFMKVPLIRKRTLASVGLYTFVAVLFEIHRGLSVVVLLVGIACVGLLYSRHSKSIEQKLLALNE